MLPGFIPGETLAIVGESGSGKSVFTKSFLGMLDANGSITGGSILFEGKDLAKYKTEKDWMTIRGKKISMVMQDPMTSLNPLKKIGRQIEESIELNQGIKGAGSKEDGSGDAEESRDPGSGAPVSAVSPRIFRRYETARGDRHSRCLPSLRS